MLYVLLKIDKRLKKISLCSKFNSDIQHTVTSDGSLEVYLKSKKNKVLLYFVPLLTSLSQIYQPEETGSIFLFPFQVRLFEWSGGKLENCVDKKKSCYIFILLRNMMSHSAPNQISKLQRKICKISLFFQTGLGKS